MSLREEQCNKVCRILDDVLANRPTERDSLIVAIRKAFAEPQGRKTGRWIDCCRQTYCFVYCSECKYVRDDNKHTPYCPNCGCKMEGADG